MRCGKLAGVFYRNERQRHSFVVSQREQGRTHLAMLLRFWLLDHFAREGWQGVREFVIAVGASDLLDQIDLALDIQSPRGNLYRELGCVRLFRSDVEPQPLQESHDLITGGLVSQNAAHF